MINVNGKQTSRVREANKTRQAFLRTKIGQQVTELKRAELELCSRGFQRGKNGIKKYLDNIVLAKPNANSCTKQYRTMTQAKDPFVQLCKSNLIAAGTFGAKLAPSEDPNAKQKHINQ
ncbi:hypothetical protein M8J76_004708 [Diaphorina citri]|nr:hypothetical protein M8J76_004708 [Diaphorina citri]